MASVVDILMARKGTVDPHFVGVNQASAGDREWFRLRGETEAGFIARVRREARVEGYRVAKLGGCINVIEESTDA